MIHLRTIDVWDTLLRRRCHPDAVKLHLAGWLLTRRWEEVPPALRSPRALLALRIQAEREIARTGRSDPSRDDEYAWRDVLERWTVTALGSASADSALIEALESEEFAQEKRVAYADPGIATWLARQSPGRTLFLSDFYMPASRIQALLDTQGLSALVEGGLCSCDLGLNKRSGRLFLALHRLRGITPAEHLHLGDNRESDVRVPRRLGIAAKRYDNPREERRREFNRKVFNNRGHLIRSLTMQAIKALDAPKNRDARDAFRFGVESAPLFVGFGLFLLEWANRRRPGPIYFLSREGAFFATLYSALRKSSATPGSRAPEALRLDISRRASFAASLRDISIEEMQRMWRGYEPVTMRAWALSLDLDLGEVEGWCQRHGLQLDEPLPTPGTEPRLKGLLNDERCRASLATHISDRAALLRDYLAQCGLNAGTQAAAVVDIGWRGTIQDNLALVLPGVRFEGYYLGLQAFLNPQPPNAVKCSYGPDLNHGGGGATLFRRLPLIEMLCTPAQGGVIGYRRETDGSVSPVRTEDEQIDSLIWRRAVEPFQAGVIQAIPMWAEALKVHAVDSSELHQGALDCWHRIIQKSPRVIEQARASLVHDERFGRGRLAPLKERRRLFPPILV